MNAKIPLYKNYRFTSHIEIFEQQTHGVDRI